MTGRQNAGRAAYDVHAIVVATPMDFPPDVSDIEKAIIARVAPYTMTSAEQYIEENGLRLLRNRIDYTGRIAVKAGG